MSLPAAKHFWRDCCFDAPGVTRGHYDPPPVNPPSSALAAPAITPLEALQAVIGSLDALRNGRALYVLMGTFTVTGLLLTMAQGALTRDAQLLGLTELVLAVAAVFYGASAAGLLVMDQAFGRPLREVADAVADALALGHRLLAVLLLAATPPILAVAVAAGLMALARPDVSGAIGPWIYAVALPAGVIVIGTLALALTAVVVPLAGPAIWAGMGIVQTVRWLAVQVRRRLFLAAILMAAVAGLTSVVVALVAAVVVTGGRVMALLGIFVGGLDLTPAQVMAALSGIGLRGAVAGTVYGHAALVGGNVVFALALVTPALVTLRGACAAFLVLQRPDEGGAVSPHE